MTTKPTYTPAIRFPDFLNDGEWEDYSIEEVFDIRNGYTPSKSKTDYWENGTIPWFRMEDIRANGNILSDSIQHITPEAVKGFGLLPAYSIIVATSATIGEHALITVESLANQRFTYLSKKKSFEERVDMMYFHYYMFVIDEWCKKNTNTGGFLSVNMSAFRQLRIPLPPLAEQRRIAACLSALDEMLAATNEKLEQMKAYKKGLMQKLFPAKGKKLPELRFKEFEKDGEWETYKVSDLFKITRGYVLPASETKATPDNIYKYPVYSSQTANNGLMGYYFKALYKNAITWTTDGANAGTVRFREGDFYCTNVCGVLIDDKGYSNLCVAEILGMVSKKYVSLVGNPKLMNNVMGEIPICIPSLPEQRTISALLSSMDISISAYEEKLKALGQYKKGLMQQMFPTSK